MSKFRWLAAAALLSSLAQAAPARMYVVACDIIDRSGTVVRKGSGGFCEFLPDGKTIMSTRRDLIVYTPEMKVLSRQTIHVHHQMSFSPADKTVLMISSEFYPDSKRIDNLLITDMNGKLLRKFRFTPKLSLRVDKIKWDQDYLKGHELEYTHVNSFYRIPKNSSKHPALKEGNYIVNDVFGASYVFDAKLKKILATFRHQKMGYLCLHDMQVLENGNLLFYENENSLKKKMYSTLVEYDPVAMKVVWSYERNPKESFHSPSSGNVQLLPNGNILFSDVTKTFDAIEIDRAGKEVWKLADIKDNFKLNQVKEVDLTDFFANSKSY